MFRIVTRTVRAVVTMRGHVGSLRAICLLAVGVLLAAPVGAVELVPGGYGQAVDPSLGGADPAHDRFAFGAGDNMSGLSLDFTPRHGTTLWSSKDEAGSPDLRFDLNVTRQPAALAEQLGLASGGGAVHGGKPRSSQPSLTVGGAMRWSDWSLGGGYGRAEIMGTDVDLLSATVGYGRLSAEIAFGQSVDYQTAPRDVLMLSTDLAAWSWLTLESNLAVGSAGSASDRDDTESVAVGRVGLRLNF
jgi:hypothetical protein